MQNTGAIQHFNLPICLITDKNRFIVNFICCRKPEVMGAMTKFSKHESLYAVEKDK
jgi:hypothetical protein